MVCISMIIRHQVGGHSTNFGQTIDLDEVGVGPCRHRRAQQRQWHRRGPIAICLQRAEQFDGVWTGLQHLGQHGRHQEGAIGSLQDRPCQRGAIGVSSHHTGHPIVDAELHI